MLAMKQVRFDYDRKPLFEAVSFEVAAGERAVLFGLNGSGKTTLFRLVTGELMPQAGTIDCHGEVGLVRQTIESEDMSLLEWVMRSDPERYALYEEVSSGDEVRVMRSYERALSLDVYNLEQEAIQALTRLGLDGQLDQNINDLSGGEKTRAQLSTLMMKQVDVVLLDEPTNHLDVESIDWLTKWLNRFEGTVLIISHDRQLMDDVATVILELSDGEVTRYPGNYTAYRRQKEDERLRDERAHARYVSRKTELLDMIAQYKGWHLKAKATASVRSPGAQKGAANLAVRMKAREQKLKQLEDNRPRKPKEEKAISVQFAADELEAKTWLTCEEVTFGYDKSFYEPISFSIQKSERVSIIGPNGSGKTTLLNVLIGERAPLSGVIKRHPRLKIGYFSQTLERLPKTGTLLDALLAQSDIGETEARTLLAHFLFRRDEVHRPIDEASMGEKCRIAFLILYFSDAHLLALDEPTNYLDVATREQIETALSVYPGGLLLITHDRYFHRLTSRTIELGKTIRIRENMENDEPVDVEQMMQTMDELTKYDLKFFDEAGNLLPFDETSGMNRIE
ncbi:ABC-F family ATP-binding cassette domain-containing protein [Exiguobacterium sp. MMG028]|uniref:ribosomal protection-like ABC-F family protein n=1 Tax=Exiguobacterium sp. MMG028 TaxID=3021979 RepID=UPI0022FEFD63|nr:ABC-F family ATP-binding cassette domain-containing protein [Exiguobacterium sp. MMG028]MDA5560390.1 ABC-F family ATP-binding cassette domain-containing protein [Exiguobacterium sp. MMG028]